MKALSILALLMTRAAAELYFDLAARTLAARCSANYSKECWGQFHQDGFCMQKIPDPHDDISDKVKFLPCRDDVPAQMWQFESVERGYLNGLLYNRVGGCLAILGTIRKGKNLKVVQCDASKSKQQWWSDGDSLNPFGYQPIPNRNPTYCVSPKSDPIKQRDAVILKDCGEAFSLDY